MRRLRSRLNLKLVAVLALLMLASSLLAFAAARRTEFGTPEEQAAVRTSRDVSLLPIRSACTVIPEKELFVTDVTVVDDCWRTSWGGICPAPPIAPATRGAWTFRAQMAAVAGTNDPIALSAFTRNWLNHWASDQIVNGDTVPARPNVQSILNGWPKLSGSATLLDMDQAPFRLLAIVSRLDLRQNAGYSDGTTAGEGRFVYGLLQNGNSTQFLVIFEYGLDAGSCHDVLDWANAWHSLGTRVPGADYNAALQRVTDRFATIGASPGKPNGSAINQIRTNDFHLLPLWELREFRLDGDAAPSPLEQVTVAQNPDRGLHQTDAISTYVNDNEPDVLAHRHVVPLSWNGQPFRGGAAPHTLELGWDGPPPACTSIDNSEARHAFSLDTCSGCHGQETATGFKHVEPRNAGFPSALSAFLTGGSATDRCGLTHRFGDIDRRRVDLCQLLEKSCSQIDSEPVITFVH